MAPGEILLEEFLKPLELGQVEAARRLEISLNRMTEKQWEVFPPELPAWILVVGSIAAFGTVNPLGGRRE